MSTPSPFSQHLADQLIRELVRTRRPATPAEVRQIQERIATAPFNTQVVPVPVRYRGKSYRGHTLGAREPSLVLHLMLRVTIDEQWADGTTETEYVTDLHQAARGASARIAVYDRRGGPIAGLFVRNTVEQARLGLRAEPWIYIVYSPARRAILSGYQVSGLQTVSIPGDALWLN